MRRSKRLKKNQDGEKQEEKKNEVKLIEEFYICLNYQ